ncbi:MAG: hypothetical protein LBG61_05540 [Burkholderiales bacterium]|jgi:hypothetical protein|nr:hypothetical protein [Burkholderiales bacterium]
MNERLQQMDWILFWLLLIPLLVLVDLNLHLFLLMNKNNQMALNGLMFINASMSLAGGVSLIWLCLFGAMSWVTYVVIFTIICGFPFVEFALLVYEKLRSRWKFVFNAEKLLRIIFVLFVTYYSTLFVGVCIVAVYIHLNKWWMV